MVQITPSDARFPGPRPRELFQQKEELPAVFPIQSVHIDWDRLIVKRPTVLETIDAMPAYLFKPEIIGLLDAEKHPTYPVDPRSDVDHRGADLRGAGPHPCELHRCRL